MDSEIILFIIVLVISIIGSVAKSKKRESDADDGYAPVPPYQQHPQQYTPYPAQQQYQQPPVPMPPYQQRPVPVQPKPMLKSAPAAAAKTQLVPFEEGQRVTVSRKVEEKVVERTGLRNKENLKRAIIFGEVLAPKF